MKKWVCDGCGEFKPVLNDEWGYPLCEECDPRLHAKARLVSRKDKTRLADPTLRGLM